MLSQENKTYTTKDSTTGTTTTATTTATATTITTTATNTIPKASLGSEEKNSEWRTGTRTKIGEFPRKTKILKLARGGQSEAIALKSRPAKTSEGTPRV